MPNSQRRRPLTGIGIPIINLRRSDDRLRFILGIPMLIRRLRLSEYSLPRWRNPPHHSQCTRSPTVIPTRIVETTMVMTSITESRDHGTLWCVVWKKSLDHSVASGHHSILTGVGSGVGGGGSEVRFTKFPRKVHSRCYKIDVIFFKSRWYWTGVTSTQLRRPLPYMYMISKGSHCFDLSLKKILGKLRDNGYWFLQVRPSLMG